MIIMRNYLWRRVQMGDEPLFFYLGARVAFAIDLQQLPQIDMSVFLGGGQALMSQKFLDDS